MDQIPLEPFPVRGLLPKKETGVVSFLNKYPEYDGRNTIIAIFDSGVDPGAPGLQTTSDGKVKVIHRFDCSGCGDVNTTTIVTPVNGYITTLTDRKLKIPSSWKNSGTTFRIGVKHAYDLYPERLKDRIKQEYKKKHWEEDHRRSIADITREIAEFESKHSGSNLTEAEKLEKENLEAKLEVLNSFDKKYSDAGPVYDVILFREEDQWKVCVNTRLDGDLSKCPVLGEYSITHEYAPLTEEDQLNFSVNVHNNGSVVELVGLSSSHGTHVAAIASAHFPDNPEQNGIAPGAQIVSLSIGDGRLISMETGTAIVRAMIKVMELRKTTPINVINMSYGEHANWVDSGRIGELVNEIVNKYGVVWVASAGNSGPALGTISTPSDISQEPVISVGAYVSPAMMEAEYSLRNKLPGAPYTWSSRGPTLDGGIGVHICAPGGAITSVPNFTLRYSQLMNGTSMASPNVAGGISCLISGMKHRNLSLSPYLIKKAIENTATHLDNVEHFAQGSGLVQIDKAFEYLLKYNDIPEKNVRFVVICGTNNCKGIYVRNKNCNKEYTLKVSVEPCFLDSENTPAEEKINFNMKFALTCEADYVSHPAFLDLSNLARIFNVKIDTTMLSEGVHSTFVNAYHVGAADKGPVFKIPVTVVKPHSLPESRNMAIYKAVPFKPGVLKRYFYAVPNGATWAVIRINADDPEGKYIIHTMQFLPRRCSKSMEMIKITSLQPSLENVFNFRVCDDQVLEVVIANYWANTNDSLLDYTITFFGIKPNCSSITMHAADGIHSLELKTLQGEEIAPSISLKHAVQILRPVEGKIMPLTSRDIIPPFRQIYEFVLSYSFALTKGCEVSPNFALLSDMLYESEFESQLWHLYDSNKQLMGYGDAYPRKYVIKLEKGEYCIKLQVRHDKKEYLEKLNEAAILLYQKLPSGLNLDAYNNYTNALIATKKNGNAFSAVPGVPIPIYIAPLAAEKYNQKTNNSAHYLTGIATFAKDELGKKVDIYPVKYILNDTASKKGSSGGNFEKSKLEEYNEAIRDIKTQWIAKIDSANVEKHYEEVKAEFPDHLPVHIAYLQAIDVLDKKCLPSLSQNVTASKTDLEKILPICNKVIDSVDEEALLAFAAIKSDTRNDAAKIKSQMDMQKNCLVEALTRKGITLCRLSTLEKEQDYSGEISAVWSKMMKFVDPSESKVSHVLYFAIWHSFIEEKYGRVLKFLFKLQEDKSSKEVEERILEYCKALEWVHVEKLILKSMPSKYPDAFKPF